jgi:hypothetical protein
MTYLKRTSVGPYYPLSPFHKSFLIPHETSDLNYIAGNIVVQYLHCLRYRDTPCKKFDHVSCFNNNIWVICFARRSNRHGTMDEIESTSNSLSCKSTKDESENIAGMLHEVPMHE